MRLLFSAGVPCQAGCKYCFAKWKDVNYSMTRFEDVRLNEESAIVYPCCDGEFFDQNNIIDYVRELANQMNKVYLSISTKREINNDEIVSLTRLNHELVSSNKGFVKVAISLSSISMLEEIEPNTMTYTERLSLASKIVESGLKLALTIKPVLPFVASEEYCRIINDFSQYTSRVLIGGLYVEPDSEFCTQYIGAQYSVLPRIVNWIPSNPKWNYIEDNDQFKVIREYAREHSIMIFDSDVDLINSLIE